MSERQIERDRERNRESSERSDAYLVQVARAETLVQLGQNSP